MKNIEYYDQQFKDNLEVWANRYKLIGLDYESPMYCSLEGVDRSDLRPTTLHFQSSISSALRFQITIDKHGDYPELMHIGRFVELSDHFRQLKYSYLKKYHPTVYNELPLLHSRHTKEVQDV